MAVTKDDVLANLARVSCPDGSPLHKSGALSDVLATDGKMYVVNSDLYGLVPRMHPKPPFTVDVVTVPQGF